MWTRAELKDNAKKFFKYNYWKMVLVSLVLGFAGGSSGGGGARVSFTRTYTYSLDDLSTPEFMGFLVGFFSVFMIAMVIGMAVAVFLLYPLHVGAQRFFVVSHYQKAEPGELGYAFSNGYMNVVKTMFLRGLFTFLWTLLFIIPGIIKGYEYRMIPYILAENPGIDSREAFAVSKQMMDGNKWAAFVLDLSFLGWQILSVFTCGILSVFYVPTANFMLLRIRKKDISSEMLFERAIREKMMIRDCSDFLFLDKEYIRFCFLNPEQNDRLAECLLSPDMEPFRA